MASRSTFTPRDAGLLVLLATFWGNSFLFIKFAVESIAPVWIVAGRLTIGGLLLLALVLTRPGGIARVPRNPRTIGALALVGTIGSGLPWLGQAWSQQFLDSGLVAVLNSTTPVATLIIAVVAGQERLHRARVVGLAVAITGTLIVIGGEVSAGGPPLALATAALATFGYGVGTVITRAKISGKHPPMSAVVVQLLCGSLALNGIGLAVEGTPPLPWTVTPLAGGALLGLGVLGTGVAFLIYFTLIERVGATNASMVTYLVPIVGLFSGAVIRGERFGLNVLLGAAVLIAGVWLAQRQPADQPETPTLVEPLG